MLVMICTKYRKNPLTTVAHSINKFIANHIHYSGVKTDIFEGLKSYSPPKKIRPIFLVLK